MKTQKQLVFPNIPRKFGERFPQGFVNDCKGWNFSRADLLDAKKNGKMLTMDLDMPGRSICSLRCGHCFNPVRSLKGTGALLTEREIKDILREAKSLGLRSVKIIGPGEPLEEKILIPFLEFMARLDIQPLIFTKGTAFGNQKKSRLIHGMDADALARLLHDEFDATICFGANSFDPALQSDIVGRDSYPRVRTRAIEVLADQGFNEFVPGEATRLALVMNPIMKSNLDEIFEVYKWSRLRNIAVIASPPMVSGPCSEPEVYSQLSPSAQELVDLYININRWAIEHGMFSLEDVERDGVASYAGARPCQQIGVALFIRRDGLALRCPGDDTSIQGHLRESGLSEIWMQSENLLEHSGNVNVGCPPKMGKTFPEGFFEAVLRGLRDALG